MNAQPVTPITHEVNGHVDKIFAKLEEHKELKKVIKEVYKNNPEKCKEKFLIVANEMIPTWGRVTYDDIIVKLNKWMNKQLRDVQNAKNSDESLYPIHDDIKYAT